MSVVFTCFIVTIIYILIRYQKFKKNQIWIKNSIPFKAYNIIDIAPEIFRKPVFQINYEDFLTYGPVYGCFRAGVPTLCLNDLELLKKLFIGESSSFVNRSEFKTGHPVLDSMLFVARDDQWKRLRSIMSPTFTKNKIRNMYPLFKQCAANTCVKLEQLVNADVEFDLKMLWSSYTADSIGKCCFAVNINLDEEQQVNQFTNSLKSYESQFIKYMNKMVHVPVLQFILFINLPKFIRNNIIGLRFFPNESVEFFDRLIKMIVKRRKSSNNNIVSDFLQFLFEHNDDYLTTSGKTVSSNLRLSSDEIVAQCLIFMIGGYDTTKSLLSWLSHRLTIHQNIQEKAHQEVMYFLEKETNNNLDEITIESLDQFEYLNALIQETLRFYPPLTLIERAASRDVYLKELDMTIEKGTEVALSIYNLHHDPKYFPEPELFVPERWLSEEYLCENGSRLKEIDIKFGQAMDDGLMGRVRKINKEAYVPFGMSFRSCIGRNFALVDAKIVLTHVLSKYKFVSGPKTVIKPKCKPSIAFIHSDELQVKVVRR